MPSAGFEPTISVGERPQNYTLDRSATGTGFLKDLLTSITDFVFNPGKNSRDTSV